MAISSLRAGSLLGLTQGVSHEIYFGRERLVASEESRERIAWGGGELARTRPNPLAAVSLLRFRGVSLCFDFVLTNKKLIN